MIQGLTPILCGSSAGRAMVRISPLDHAAWRVVGLGPEMVNGNGVEGRNNLTFSVKGSLKGGMK